MSPAGIRERSDVEAYYDRRWRRSDRLNVPRFLRHRRVLAEVRRWAPPGRPLQAVELGCGRGDLAAHLARRGLRVTAVDLSATTVETNRRRYPEVDFRRGDVTDRGLPAALGREFDVVVSSEVAEHVDLEWRQAFFANLAALARPGGLLVLTTPDRGVLESRGRPLEDDQPVNHLFTRSELVGWLDGEFEVLSHGGVHPVVRRRWLDLAWKVLFLPVGYRGVHRLARALSIPGAYQVVAMRRRAPA